MSSYAHWHAFLRDTQLSHKKMKTLFLWNMSKSRRRLTNHQYQFGNNIQWYRKHSLFNFFYLTAMIFSQTRRVNLSCPPNWEVFSPLYLGDQFIKVYKHCLNILGFISWFSSLLDEFPRLRSSPWRNVASRSILCLICFLLGIPMVGKRNCLSFNWQSAWCTT